MAEGGKRSPSKGSKSFGYLPTKLGDQRPSLGRGITPSLSLGRGINPQMGATGSTLLSVLKAKKAQTSSDESGHDSKTSSLIANLKKIKPFSSRGRGCTTSSSSDTKDSAYATTSDQADNLQQISVKNEHIKPKAPLPVVPTPEPIIKVEKEIHPAAPPKPVDIKVSDRDVLTYHGSSGQPMPLHANCIPIQFCNKAVYEYHVSYSPEVDNNNLRYIFLNEHRDVIGSTKAFDGSVLFLPKLLDTSEMHLQSIRRSDNATINIKIQLIRALHPASPLLLRFYNIVLHKIMKILKLCPVGRNYYDPTMPENIEQHRVVLWPGFVTSIKELEGGLFLMIDVSHKVLRKETVMDVMRDLFMKNKSNFQEMCLKELVGCSVLTRYNNKTYRIDDIDFNATPQSTFTNTKGETLSFLDYYKSSYKLDIKDANQPLLLNRPKTSTKRGKREEEGKPKVLSLIPEFCFLTGLSEKITSNFSAMKDIGKVTRIGPDLRNSKIVQFINKIISTPEANEELQKWGLCLHNDTAAVKGRRFPPEKVLVGNNRVFACDDEADFGRDIGKHAVIRGIAINKWALLFVDRDRLKAKNFADKLREVGGKLGIRVQPPQMICLNNDRMGTYRQALSNVITPTLQLVVCILPFSRADTYSAVKKLCCIEMPVPSQVIISKTLPAEEKSGKFRSVTMKIALQINCKLGGELWALEIPLKKLMVCGIDVYHEGKGAGKSVAAFVASMNDLFTRWHSRAKIQLPQQEIIDSLKHCFTDILTKYYEVNNYLPERIVLYRDGVGDGQLNTVANYEIPQLRSSLKMLDSLYGGEYNPKFTVVVVSKRINLRYFKNVKTMSNPPPGTVLDNTVTRADRKDFFLISQHIRQGTVTPTHYICVDGAEHLKPDHLQRLTYKLTHMYYNWPGTIRVPAPCQYAHKLAYLVGENLNGQPSLDMCNKLFYL